MTGVLNRRGRDTRDAHTEKRPAEDTARRWLSASQGQKTWV